MKLSKYEKGAYVAPRPPQGRVTFPRVVIASALVLVVFAGAMQAWNSLRGSGATASAASAPSPVEKTVFTPDGKPISSDPLTIAGVEVSERAVNLGLQPLSTGVAHEFKLRNTSSTAVTLGKAGIEVLQGCCPSDPILTATRLAPGAEVPVLFSLPMGMHQGMDGPHLFRVTVGVKNDSGESGVVELYVKADFRAGASGGTDHAGHTS